MHVRPMKTEEIHDALAGADSKKEIKAVMALLKGLEIQSQDGIRIGQPDEERRDISAMTYAYQEAQETIVAAIESANRRAGAAS